MQAKSEIRTPSLPALLHPCRFARVPVPVHVPVSVSVLIISHGLAAAAAAALVGDLLLPVVPAARPGPRLAWLWAR